MRRRVEALALMTTCAAFLAGCFMYETAIVMKDPRTEQVIVCRRTAQDSLTAADRCAEALERAGWIRAGTSP